MSNNTVSLDGRTVSVLAKLQAQIDIRIKEKLAETKVDVKNKILALLSESGFTLSDIFPSASQQKETASPAKKSVRVKYSDGQNTWTGRGRTPLWVKSFVESGGTLASLEVLK